MADHEALLRLSHGRVATVRGSADDDGVLAALVESGGVYEAHLQTFMRDRIGPDDVCVDAGANIGLHTLQMAQLAPAGSVLAFEPGEESLAYLRSNVDAAGLDNVRLFPIGLYSTAGPLRFAESRTHPGGSFVAPTDIDLGGAETTVEIEVATLDEIVRREDLDRLDFVKVDVEGSEIHFLAGAAASLDRFRPVIVIECNPIPLLRFQGRSPVDLFDALRGIYGRVGYVDQDGEPMRIRSARHLRYLLVRHGLVDLVAGCSFAHHPRRRLREARQRLRSRWESSTAVVASRARSRTDHVTSQGFVGTPSATVRCDETRVAAAPGELLTIDLGIENTGPIWLAGTDPDRPVGAAYRVRDANGALVDEHGLLSPLTRPIGPRRAATQAVAVRAPDLPGSYTIDLTLRQEGHVWFDQLDAAARATVELTVDPPTASAPVGQRSAISR